MRGRATGARSSEGSECWLRPHTECQELFWLWGVIREWASSLSLHRVVICRGYKITYVISKWYSVLEGEQCMDKKKGERWEGWVRESEGELQGGPHLRGWHLSKDLEWELELSGRLYVEGSEQSKWHVQRLWGWGLHDVFEEAGGAGEEWGKGRMVQVRSEGKQRQVKSGLSGHCKHVGFWSVKMSFARSCTFLRRENRGLACHTGVKPAELRSSPGF